MRKHTNKSFGLEVYVVLVSYAFGLEEIGVLEIPLCDTRVKEQYMNKLRPHSNESNPQDRMSKKDLKNLKVLTIPTRCTFFYGSSIIRTYVLLGAILCWVN